MNLPLYLGLLSAFILRRWYLTFLENLRFLFFSLYLCRQSLLFLVNSSTSSETSEDSWEGTWAAPLVWFTILASLKRRWCSSQESKILSKLSSRSKGLAQSSMSRKPRAGTAAGGGASWKAWCSSGTA